MSTVLLIGPSSKKVQRAIRVHTGGPDAVKKGRQPQKSPVIDVHNLPKEKEIYRFIYTFGVSFLSLCVHYHQSTDVQVASFGKTLFTTYLKHATQKPTHHNNAESLWHKMKAFLYTNAFLLFQSDEKVDAFTTYLTCVNQLTALQFGEGRNYPYRKNANPSASPVQKHMVDVAEAFQKCGLSFDLLHMFDAVFDEPTLTRFCDMQTDKHPVPLASLHELAEAIASFRKTLVDNVANSATEVLMIHALAIVLLLVQQPTFKFKQDQVRLHLFTPFPHIPGPLQAAFLNSFDQLQQDIRMWAGNKGPVQTSSQAKGGKYHKVLTACPYVLPMLALVFALGHVGVHSQVRVGDEHAMKFEGPASLYEDRIVELTSQAVQHPQKLRCGSLDIELYRCVFKDEFGYDEKTKEFRKPPKIHSERLHDFLNYVKKHFKALSEKSKQMGVLDRMEDDSVIIYDVSFSVEPKEERGEGEEEKEGTVSSQSESEDEGEDASESEEPDANIRDENEKGDPEEEWIDPHSSVPVAPLTIKTRAAKRKSKPTDPKIKIKPEFKADFNYPLDLLATLSTQPAYFPMPPSPTYMDHSSYSSVLDSFDLPALPSAFNVQAVIESARRATQADASMSLQAGHDSTPIFISPDLSPNPMSHAHLVPPFILGDTSPSLVLNAPFHLLKLQGVKREDEEETESQPGAPKKCKLTPVLADDNTTMTYTFPTEEAQSPALLKAICVCSDTTGTLSPEFNASTMEWNPLALSASMIERAVFPPLVLDLKTVMGSPAPPFSLAFHSDTSMQAFSLLGKTQDQVVAELSELDSYGAKPYVEGYCALFPILKRAFHLFKTSKPADSAAPTLLSCHLPFAYTIQMEGHFLLKPLGDESLNGGPIGLEIVQDTGRTPFLFHESAIPKSEDAQTLEAFFHTQAGEPSAFVKDAWLFHFVMCCILRKEIPLGSSLFRVEGGRRISFYFPSTQLQTAFLPLAPLTDGRMFARRWMVQPCFKNLERSLSCMVSFIKSFSKFMGFVRQQIQQMGILESPGVLRKWAIFEPFQAPLYFLFADISDLCTPPRPVIL